MPVIEVKMWEGREDKLKAKIIKDITDAFVSIGVSANAVTVILTEYSKKNWGEGGKLASLT
ncbi:MAG: tautomerase family protein [Candidatus Bathyarchaeota archaeon]